MTAAEMASLFPAHQGTLSLVHNDHKNEEQTVSEWLESMDSDGQSDFYEWVSDEQKQKAIASDTMWTLQWSPNDPESYYAMAAADLDALLTAARSAEIEG